MLAGGLKGFAYSSLICFLNSNFSLRSSSASSCMFFFRFIILGFDFTGLSIVFFHFFWTFFPSVESIKLLFYWIKPILSNRFLDFFALSFRSNADKAFSLYRGSLFFSMLRRINWIGRVSILSWMVLYPLIFFSERGAIKSLLFWLFSSEIVCKYLFPFRVMLLGSYYALKDSTRNMGSAGSLCSMSYEGRSIFFWGGVGMSCLLGILMGSIPLMGLYGLVVVKLWKQSTSLFIFLIRYCSADEVLEGGKILSSKLFCRMQ